MCRQVVIFFAILVLCCSIVCAQEAPAQGQATSLAAADIASALADVPQGQALVSYESGELKIQAHALPLIDVLRSVCIQIGAELDAPSEANEPVLGVFGPGPAREVLTSVLKGFPYELGTSGSVADPNVLVRIVVFRNSKTEDSARQETKTPNPVNATAEPATQPQLDSSSTGEKANVQQMLELLDEAKANFVDNEADPDDPSAGVVKAQTGDIFKALESIVKKAAAAEASGASASTIAPRTGNAGSVGSSVPAPRRRR
jgi:hypothetical protein